MRRTPGTPARPHAAADPAARSSAPRATDAKPSQSAATDGRSYPANVGRSHVGLRRRVRLEPRARLVPPGSGVPPRLG